MGTLVTSVRGSVARRPEPFSAAYTWLLLFMVVYCARPEDWIPGLRSVPLAKITGFFALAAFFLSLGYSGQSLLRLPREVAYLVALFGQFCLAVVFSPVWKGGAFDVVIFQFSKVVVIIIVMALTVLTAARLRKLLFVQTASVVFVVGLAVVKSRLVGGRLDSVIGGIYGNPNELAFSVALAFPFCLLFFLRTRKVLSKLTWGFAMVIMIYALLLTYSRGGLLALLTAAFVCLWEFGIKGRRHHLLILAILIVLGFLLVGGPAGYGERVRTIFNPDSDLTGSAQARRQVFRHSLEVTGEHPLFGVGPGNFQVLAGDWLETHNTYTQLSSEGGVAALILFLLILWRAFFNVRDTKRLERNQPELFLWACAMRASLAGFVVGCFFASVAYHFFPYFLVGYTTALYQIARTNDTSSSESSVVRRDAGSAAKGYLTNRKPKTTWSAY